MNDFIDNLQYRTGLLLGKTYCTKVSLDKLLHIFSRSIPMQEGIREAYPPSFTKEFEKACGQRPLLDKDLVLMNTSSEQSKEEGQEDTQSITSDSLRLEQYLTSLAERIC